MTGTGTGACVTGTGTGACVTGTGTGACVTGTETGDSGGSLAMQMVSWSYKKPSMVLTKPLGDCGDESSSKAVV